nr:hypothetical protein [uncultured Fluviicola sp.]
MSKIYNIEILLFFVFFVCLGYSQTINNNLLGKRNIPFLETSSIYQPVRVKESVGEYLFILSTPVVKQNEAFILDIPTRRPFSRVEQMELKNITIPDSTFFVAFGIFTLLSKEMEQGDVLPMVSFEISNMPKIGDSALFEFSIIRDNSDGTEFSPEVYFSKSIEFRDGMIQGFKKFEPAGKLQLVKKSHHLYYGYYKILVTKEMVGKEWIHLVIPYTGDLSYPFAKGLIAPFSLIELNEKPRQINSENVSSLRFDLFSSTLSIIDSEKLKSWTKSNQGASKVQISSALTNSGNKENAVFLAYLRMEAVLKKLVENGISVEKIEVVSPQFKDGQNEELNRTVQVRFL